MALLHRATWWSNYDDEVTDVYDYLKTVPLIDTHVHRVHPSREPEFGQIAGGYIPGPGQEKHARQTLLYGMIMRELGKYYGMPAESTLEQIEQERHRRFWLDPVSYMKNLYAQGNVAMYCFEIGSPLRGKAFTEEEIAYFNEAIPNEKRCCIVRIERSVDETLEKGLPFSEFLDVFEKDLCKRIEQEQAIALKSSIAYYGGLNFVFASDKAASQAYEKIRNRIGTEEDEKILYAYTLMIGVEVAVCYEIPIQIHTGAGGGSYLDFKSFNPIGMTDFFRDSRILNRARIVLLHGGHPHEEDVSFLTAQYSNVYADCSGTFFLCSLNGVNRLRALMERTPMDKLMYGSDGVMVPETSWFAAGYFRRLLATTLNQLIHEGIVDEVRAQAIGKMILYDNAINCYSKLKQRLKG